MYIIFDFVGVMSKRIDETNGKNKAARVKAVKGYITDFVGDLHKKYRRCPQHFEVQRTGEREVELEFDIGEEF